MAKIPIILEPGRADGKLAESQAIYDSILEQFQSNINGEYKLTKKQVEFLTPIIERLNDVQDTLTSIDADKPLSAQQGKILKELLDAKVIEVGGIPMDSEPTEGNTEHVVTSDGINKALAKKVNNITFEERSKNQDEKLSELDSRTDGISKEVITTEEEKIIIEDNSGNQIAKIDSTGADFKNLKSNGRDVITNISGKQDVIVDLDTIRSGAANGTTAKADVETLQDKTSEISKETIETDEDFIIIEDKNGNEVFHIDENGLDAKNVKSNGKEVLTEHQDISGLETIANAIDNRTDNIHKENILSEDEEIVIENRKGETIVSISEYGADFKGLKSDGKDVLTGSKEETSEPFDSMDILAGNGEMVLHLDENGFNAKHVKSNGKDVLIKEIFDNKLNEAHLVRLASFKRSNLSLSTGVPSTEYSPLSIMCFTDTHGEMYGIKENIAFWQKYKQYLDDAIILGDMSPVYWSAYNESAHNNIEHYNEVLKVIGNHDIYGYPNITTQDYSNPIYNAPDIEKFKRYFKGIESWNVNRPNGAELQASEYYGACYYYKDYISNNVRLIVLDCMNWTDTQKNWLESVLADARNKGTHVICCQHVQQSYDGFEPFETAWNSEDLELTATELMSNKVILNVVQNFIDEGGIFVCWLFGHVHRDQCGIIKGYPKQIYIVLAASTAPNGVWQDMERIEGTDSRYVNTVLSVEPSNRYIRLYRIGANITRHGQVKNVLCIDYGKRSIKF